MKEEDNRNGAFHRSSGPDLAASGGALPETPCPRTIIVRPVLPRLRLFLSLSPAIMHSLALLSVFTTGACALYAGTAQSAVMQAILPTDDVPDRLAHSETNSLVGWYDPRANGGRMLDVGCSTTCEPSS